MYTLKKGLQKGIKDLILRKIEWAPVIHEGVLSAMVNMDGTLRDRLVVLLKLSLNCD